MRVERGTIGSPSRGQQGGHRTVRDTMGGGRGHPGSRARLGRGPFVTPPLAEEDALSHRTDARTVSPKPVALRTPSSHAPGESA
jgi:hypothetical protein